MITIRFERARKLVHARMSGLLTVAEVENYGRERNAAARAMGLGNGEFDLLVEADGSVVQSQEVVAAFQHVILKTGLQPRRFATVRLGALSSIQTRRIVDVRPGNRVFATLAEAEAWLAEP